MTHTITVTAVPTQDSDDYEWSEGGSCDSRCTAYWFCGNVSHRHPSAEYGYLNGDWSTKRTPQPHRFIDGQWMIETKSTCGYQESDHGDIFFDLTKIKPQIGDTFGIDVDWDGDFWRVAVEPQPMRDGREES